MASSSEASRPTDLKFWYAYADRRMLLYQRHTRVMHSMSLLLKCVLPETRVCLTQLNRDKSKNKTKNTLTTDTILWGGIVNGSNSLARRVRMPVRLGTPPSDLLISMQSLNRSLCSREGLPL